MKNLKKKIENLSDDNTKLILSLLEEFEKSPSVYKPNYKKISIMLILSRVILITTFFGGVGLSSDFRHMVFNALEGNGKVVISSEMKDLSVSEENLADVLRPTDLDGQGYSIRADGDFAKNYTLTYTKPGGIVSFDVRYGEAQLFLDTDWTGWKQANRNGCIIYISNKPDGCVLEMLMQDGIKCSIISNYLTPEETLDLSKSIGLQADTNT